MRGFRLDAGVGRALLRAWGKDRIPAVAAVRTAGETWTGVQGPAPEAGGAPGIHAPFLVYSVTKPMAAVAVLRLADRGRLTLDAPLSRWLPEAPNAGRVTPRQLLGHRAGYPDYGRLSEYHRAVRRGAAPWSDEEFLARTGASELLFEPGTGWAYSNIGYLLLRRLLEAVEAASLAEVLDAEVFRPLGLVRTRVVERPEDLRGLVFGPSAYLGEPGRPAPVADSYHPDWVAHGVAASTAPEVARFLDGLFGGRLLETERLEEMRDLVPAGEPEPDRPFVRPSYGLGLMGDPASPLKTALGHTGEGPGASTAAYHFPDLDPPLSAVVCSGEEGAARAERAVFAAAEAAADAAG